MSVRNRRLPGVGCVPEAGLFSALELEDGLDRAFVVMSRSRSTELPSFI
jgi:hypothetical protein